MKSTNLYLLNITDTKNTNGVDRYVRCLLSGLATHQQFHKIYHICFVFRDQRFLRYDVEHTGYTEIRIPLPEQFRNLIDKSYWLQQYNDYLYQSIAHLFDDTYTSIIHIHTLNLIDLACFIKQCRTLIKIITHVHCISWKNLYGIAPERFNRLYWYYHVRCDYTTAHYLTNCSEEQAYTACDHLIACAESGSQYVTRVGHTPKEHISIIPNGIADMAVGFDRAFPTSPECLNLLFVGSVIRAKGIFFILDALQRVVQAGYTVKLYIAGACNDTIRKEITERYASLPIVMLGTVSYEELNHYYRTCDVGIIGSLFEQNSYVAIEMCMFSMPIIASSAEGLDEMFVHEENALKVPVTFDRLAGLTLDIESMKSHIIRLIETPDLRLHLSHAARKLYTTHYTLDKMIERTYEVYSHIVNS